MNQELKNMELVLGSLEIALSQRDYSAAKTLSHTYERMTNNYMKKHKNNYLSDSHYNQLEKIKELHDDIIKNKIQKVISQNNFVDLNNLQLISERLYGILIDFKQSIDSYKLFNGKVAIIHKGEEILTKNDTKQLLDLSIKHGVLITQVDDKLRGTGKTVALIKKAHELDVTLIVGNHSMKRVVDGLSAQMGLHIDCRYINSLDALRGNRLKNGKFLVDDSVPNVIINELHKQMNEFVGGFNSLNDSLHKVEQKTFKDYLIGKLNNLEEEKRLKIIKASILCGNDTMSQIFKIDNQIKVIEQLISEEENK